MTDFRRWLPVCLALLFVVTGVQAQSRLFERLRWLDPEADIVGALSRQPVECLAPVAADKRGKLALGRLVFESPALLGGQPARFGLSCASCHPNGRRNADFFLPGLSDVPGTVDLTSGVFGTGNDRQANARPIPDLSRPDGRMIADRDSGAFRAKLHAIVIEEFHGAPPAAGDFRGAAFLPKPPSTIRHAAIPAATVARDWRQDWRAVETALDSLRAAVARGRPGKRGVSDPRCAPRVEDALRTI